MKKYSGILALVFFLIGCGFASAPEAKNETSNSSKKLAYHNPDMVWHWNDEFSEAEKIKIKSWLTTVDSAVSLTIGPYPFAMHVYIHRAESGNEPVPWAHTSRGGEQSVHFHVNTDYTISEFLNDWTAAHEISHLSTPFVGKKNAWFSEGYATFMQYQIMQKQGVFSAESMEEKYHKKFERCAKSYQTNLPFPAAADSLKKQWNYPDMYWGGASFFYTLNEQLKTEVDISLMQAIQKYELCCRVNEDTPTHFLEVIDSITGSNLGVTLLEKYQKQPAYLHFQNFK